MNIYEKIQVVKDKLLKENIKKSGLNKYAGYSYYELADITPYIIQFCNELKLFTSISFDKEFATLEIVNIEKPDEKVVYTSPIEQLELKGCNKIQALGGVETYSRRYLYMSAFDIIESDMFDGENGKEEIIDNLKATALITAIQKNNITDEIVYSILSKYGYKTINDIKMKDYMTIVNDLKANK